MQNARRDVTIGIDEVGRGALAGPVVVAAALIEGAEWKHDSKNKPLRKLGTLKDSKKLSARQREAWFAYFASVASAAHPKISFATARVYPREIEKRNISQAANLAAKRALARLVRNLKSNGKAGKYNNKNFEVNNLKIFLDGGLYLGNRAYQVTQFPNAKTIIKADEKIMAVSIASIVAKVYRDRLMEKMDKKYPEYSFGVHKGYGTKIHREAIRKVGPCEIHRLTFLTKSYNIST